MKYEDYDKISRALVYYFKKEKDEKSDEDCTFFIYSDCCVK